MRILNVAQGSPAWHAARVGCLTASEAPAMMGASRHIKRNELLHAKHTGKDRDVHWWVQHFLFDRGHEVEALARPIIEKILGEDLYPATVTDDEGRLLASLDGMTLMGGTLFECKLWNKELAACVIRGELEPHYYWQLEHQLIVTGAERVIFVTTDGAENLEQMEYRPVPGRAAELLAGWKQFEADLAAYKPVEHLPAPEGQAPDRLPALRIEVTGMVTASNLEQFKANAMAVIGSISTDLNTDEDFADAEQTVKWCLDVEDRLQAAKEQALSQTESIEALFLAIDKIAEETRNKRLALNKLVSRRKSEIRDGIRNAAVQALHQDYLEFSKFTKLAFFAPQSFGYEVNEAMKSKRLLSTLQDAADTTLAKARIELTALREKVIANLETLNEHGDHSHLFPDVQALVTKAPEDLEATIKARIADAKKTVEPEPAPEPPKEEPTPLDSIAERAAKIPPDNRPPMNLGEIRSALGLQVSQAFLSELGIEPAEKIKNSVIYAAADFPRICSAICAHVNQALADWQSRKEVA